MELTKKDRKRLADADWLPAVGPYGCFGQHWTVETDDTNLAELVADLYADLGINGDADPRRRNVEAGETIVAHARFQVAASRVGSRGIVARDDHLLGGGTQPATTLGSLVWGINRWVLDEASRTHLLLHAAGVVDDAGRAVVLPAPSESGKSTLTMGLLERGLAYLSDEAIALDADGGVRGYPKPVSIDPGSFEVLASHRPVGSDARSTLLERQWHFRASAITTVARRATLAAVVFPRYDRNADETLLKPLGPAAKLLNAGNSTFAPGNGRRVERDQVAALAERLTGVPAYSLISYDLQGACDAVEQMIRDPS